MLHDCDLCGSSEHTPIDVARPYIGDQDPPVVCMGCGFVYVRERRSPAEIAKAWDGIWGAGYTSSWPAVKARLTYVAEWLDQEIGLKGKSLLEIGAGEGSFLEMVRDKGAWSPRGIEPFKDNVRKVWAKGIGCCHATIETTRLEQKYDIVCLLWTLENTGDCIGVLKRAREFLSPGGVIVVATGSRILVPFHKPLSLYFSGNPADTHCFRFSRNALSEAFRQGGLVVTYGNRDYDSDWLVVAGGKTKHEMKSTRDDPAKVLRFFRSWAEQFP